MRNSKLLQKIKQGKTAKITALYHPIDMFPRHAAEAGYDAVWLEAEHHMWEPREMQRMLYLGHLADIDIIVRPPSREKAVLYRYLEQGASGIIIPQVGSREEAERLVQAVKFPPIGQRGLDGASIDSDFFLGVSKDYPRLANEQTYLIVQIENLEGFKNADEIAATPGVDGLFIGQWDMSLRLDCFMDPDNTRLIEVDDKVARACREHGKFWGRPCTSEEDVKTVIQKGAGFVNYGSDFFALSTYLSEAGKTLDKIME